MSANYEGSSKNWITLQKCDDPASVGEIPKYFFVKMLKTLLNRRVLKSWGWRWYLTGWNGQYLLVVDLGYYKRHQSQVRCASEDAELQECGLWDPTSIGERNERNICYKGVESMLVGEGWKSYPNERVLKLWSWRWAGKRMLVDLRILYNYIRLNWTISNFYLQIQLCEKKKI